MAMKIITILAPCLGGMKTPTVLPLWDCWWLTLS
jgi:hypothetical protein